MNSSDRGTFDVTFWGVILFAVTVGGVLLATQAGFIGSVASSGDGSQSLGATATPTPSSGTTVSAGTATATSADDGANVTVVFEQWGTNVSVAVIGGADRDDVVSYRVSGASVQGTLDPDADYPRVTGTVEPPTTVTVIATFEDGEEQVVGTLEIS